MGPCTALEIQIPILTPVPPPTRFHLLALLLVTIVLPTLAVCGTSGSPAPLHRMEMELGEWDSSLSGMGFYSSTSKSSSQAGFVVFDPCAGGASCYYGHVSVASGSWSNGCGTIYEGNWNGGYNTRHICL